MTTFKWISFSDDLDYITLVKNRNLELEIQITKLGDGSYTSSLRAVSFGFVSNTILAYDLKTKEEAKNVVYNFFSNIQQSIINQ